MRFKQFLNEETYDKIVIKAGDVRDGLIIPEIPETVYSFSADRQRITEFREGQCPKKVHANFDIYGCTLKSLKNGPEWVGGDFKCSYSNLTSIEYAPKYVGNHCYLDYTDITDLKGIGKLWLKEIRGELRLTGTRIMSNVLGLLLIKGLEDIVIHKDFDWFVIVNKHFESDKDILECREELIAKGLKDYAKF